MGRVAVLGSLNVDVVTLVERHPLPGETVLGQAGGRFAGGKGGNQAAAAARAGASHVQMLARVGADEAGAAYRRAPRRPGHRPVGRLDEPHGARPARRSSPSTSRARTRSSSSPAPTVSPTRRSSTQAGRLGPGDVLLCSLEVDLGTVADAARAAHAAGARVVINLAPYAALPPDVIALADPVVVNESEMRAARRLRPRAGVAARDLRRGGSAAGGRTASTAYPCRPREVGDTVGAGDAFCGALAAALAGGADRQAALEAANAAARPLCAGSVPSRTPRSDGTRFTYLAGYVTVELPYAVTGTRDRREESRMSELTQVLGRIERDGDEVAVVFDRHYATSPDDLWQACTDPERLARWFAPVSGDLRTGGRFTIHFDDADTPAVPGRPLRGADPARLGVAGRRRRRAS